MRFFRVIGFIVLAILAVGLAGAIFQAGYLAGLAADGAAPVVVGPAYGYGWHGWGWGLGGGIVGFLVFLFVLFVFLGILRAAFGGWGRGGREHGGWGPGGPGHDHLRSRFGPWEDRAREAHDEWHRQAGGTTGTPGTAGPSGPSGSGPSTDPSSGGAA